MMGTLLLRRVEACGMAGLLKGLSGNAVACLLIMALNAHDKGTDDAPRATYFRGWEHLASAALGRPTYDDAAERAVARALAELTSAGLVKPVGRRHNTRRGLGMYEIVLPI